MILGLAGQSERQAVTQFVNNLLTGEADFHLKFLE